jgi:triacylglycerol lipase
MSTETIFPQPPYPLHDSIKELIDPEYANFYNEYLLNAPQVHYQPVSASRVGGRLIPVSLLNHALCKDHRAY